MPTDFHIKWNKSIFDDLDVFLTFKSEKSQADPNKVIIDFSNQKHREDYFCNF